MGKLNIVMTGGTSGFGSIAAKELIIAPEAKVFLGYRGNQVRGAENISLDLKNLNSVRSFATEVLKRVNTEKIQILICNAGINYPDINSRTADGFETTFAVNHLAHFLLMRLLMPHLDANAKIILTTSGTHDPAEKTMIAPPIHANAFWLAHPEKDIKLDKKMIVNAQRAYSSSKLCTILTARSLSTTSEAKIRNWQSIAYDPGPTPGTGLLQNGTFIMRILWKIMAIPFIRKQILPKSNSMQQSGQMLADIALGNVLMPAGKVYAALRRGALTFPNPSQLAQNDDLMIKVWQDSEQLLGLDKS